MKAKNRRTIVLSAAAFLALAGAAAVFFARPPALLVTDPSFAALHGPHRGKWQQVSASLAAFRRVKPVVVADSAGPDVLILALEQASPRPFCVLFPYRYSEAALRYAEMYPGIRSVLLESHLSGLAARDGLSVYTTDRETDAYRAGLCAGILGGLQRKPAGGSLAGAGKQGGESAPAAEAPAVLGKSVVFHDRFATQNERDAFSRGLREAAPEAIAPNFFSSISQLTDTRDLSCVVLAGGAPEYADKNLKAPVILFTWLNPVFAPRETALVFDDSAWALAVPVLKMAAKSLPEGKIPSKILIFSTNIADKDIFRKLKKAAVKTL